MTLSTSAPAWPVLQALPGFKQEFVDGQFKACCPSHNDRDPSLGIRIADDGRILLNCRSQHCTAEQICKALGFTFVDLFPNEDKRAGNPMPLNARTVIYRYPAFDAETGVSAGTHIRKEFIGAGGRQVKPKVMWWEPNGIKLVPMALYNAKALLDARSTGKAITAIVLEGERKTDKLNEALRNAGSAYTVAVGTMTGSGQIPCDAALRILSGCDVWLWPDNDAPGRDHMLSIAERLVSFGITPKWLCWDEAPAKGDAADFVAGGGSIDQLSAMVKEVPQRHSPFLNQQVDEWEDPAPLVTELPPVAAFHENLLPLAIRDWVLDTAERMQAPVDFVGVGAMVVAGSLIGRRVGIRPKEHDDWLVVPNLWGMVIGRPSTRKSPALDATMAPLERLIAEAREANATAVSQYNAQLLIATAKKKAAQHELELAAKASARPGAGTRAKSLEELAAECVVDGPQAPVERRYKTEDATIEKLGELLRENPKGLLVHRDELPGWLRSFDRKDRGQDRTFFLEAYNGKGSYSVDRIGRGSLHIPALCLSILGGIQPGPLGKYVHDAMGDGDGDDGLLQRFQLAVWPDVESGAFRWVDRFPLAEAKNRAYEALKWLANLVPSEIGAVMDAGEDIPFVRFSASAQAIFREWYTDLNKRTRSGTLTPALEAHLGKYDSLMPKVALVSHLFEVADGAYCPDGVSEGSANRALEWCAYLETHALRIYASAANPAFEGAKKLLENVRAGKLADHATVREIYRNQWSELVTMDDVEAALAVLEHYGWAKVRDEPTGGRPARVVHFHPLALPSRGREDAA